MKAISKMDKSMEKESKKQELKNMKVVNLINQGNLCSDWDLEKESLMYLRKEILIKLIKDMKDNFI